MKRLFVGIPLSEVLKSNFIPLLNTLSISGVSPVLVQNLHLTVKFLGEVGETRVEEIFQKLERIAQHHSPFSLELKRVGVFPDEKEIHTVWVGVDSNEMISLMKETDQELNYLHLNEYKEEIPHLTIARVKVQNDKLPKLISSYQNTSFGVQDVTKICLFESKLTPNGPIYGVLGEFGLKMNLS
ncbi:MAG: RNA 2',3'-cyclic phosphodiesterase [Candidatus Woesearchaeota archaeon]|jgi:2'-5' RNA ligase